MKVAILFGGVSVEHEISIITGLQVYENIKSSYDVVNVYFSKERKFYIGKVLDDINNYHDLDKVVKQAVEVEFQNIDNKVYLVEKTLFKKKHLVDIAFMALHGASGEDGSMQGYLDILGLPYTGCSHYGSTIGQDKVYAKAVYKENQINVVDYVVVDDGMEQAEIKQIIDEFGYPIIIKPATLGSSVGIEFCDAANMALAKVNQAFEYDTKLIIERKLNNFIEVNCSILGDRYGSQVSVLEQINLEADFLSFDDKYINNDKQKGMVSTNRTIPAPISEELTKTVSKVCLRAFKCLDLSGVVRFDLMICDGKVYLNEVNTIPGSLSFYLWEHVNVSKLDLYQKLIDLAIVKKRVSKAKIASYNTNVLSSGNFKGKKLK